MYYFLSAAVKQFFIGQLRSFWSTHPKYASLVDNIQGKYAFTERVQQGIVVKVSNANKVQLSNDNYMGTVSSYCGLCRVPGSPGVSVEWVREDSLAIQQNGGVFPTPPGIYYCTMTEAEEFWVDPLLDVQNEPVTMVTSTEGALPREPYEGSLRVVELPGGRLYVPGTDYVLAGTTLTLTEPLPPGLSLVCDYRYPGEPTGPWRVDPYTGYNKPLPGVVMAFGNRYAKGDRWAVQVSAQREDTALQYGGRWELSLDLDVIARDPQDQQEIADMTLMYLYVQMRPAVVDQGIDIGDVSFGGESEEVYDETGDDYYYNAQLSVTVTTDWFLFQPLVGRMRSYNQTLAELPRNLQPSPYTDPYFTTRYTYETVR